MTCTIGIISDTHGLLRPEVLSAGPMFDAMNGLLHENPGSAGRRRFKLPVTLASLEMSADGLRQIIHHLEVG